MKKLKLNLKDVGEILTREQLKQVSGGSLIIGNCVITCKGPNGNEKKHQVPACSVGCLQGIGYYPIYCVCT